MILDKIFLQYKKKIRKSFASVWMDWHGKLFIGSPDRKDIPVVHEATAQKLRETYFYDAEDRLLDLHLVNEDEWVRGQTFLTQLRDCQAPLLSRRLFFIGCILSFVLMLFASMMGGISSTVEGWTSDWKQERAQARADKAIQKAPDLSASQCERHILTELKKDLSQAEQVALGKVQSTCMENHQEAIEASIASRLDTTDKCQEFEREHKFYDGKYWDALIAQCHSLY